MQMQFILPEIDRKSTRETVESLLEKYRMYLLQTNLDRLPSITAAYTLVLNTGGLPGSSTESAAIANVDYERERNRFIDWFARAVNRLPRDERAIIVQRYLEAEELYDYQTYAELNMSERNYFRLKSRAFYKLAFALKVEVYKEEVPVQ
ncbi:ArpU family phage packaging/lysis transcriptional regulator [Sporosarcina sp. E16_8]|uniref:ArpU family phage packaging/lysis transcriptional regulator n=1 Tax=Sporosarcina sp. E16_8 TaxID=2789295 RepID=UPI0031F8B408